ncbi:hypothetical protein LXL04_023716 [Taraxacum kok-saghyz]
MRWLANHRLPSELKQLRKTTRKRLLNATKTIDLMITKMFCSAIRIHDEKSISDALSSKKQSSNLQTFILAPSSFLPRNPENMSNPSHHSNEESSFMDTSALSQQRLTNAHQNCYANLDYTQYLASLHVLIEFLRSSVLNKALTAHADVSIKALTKAYSSAKYNSTKNIVEFDLESGKRTAITKISFTKTAKSIHRSSTNRS